jgi:uncharacterized damage-inducible protein DinB
MSDSHETLLKALLESWDRNHEVTLNLLRALPPQGLGARAAESSSTVAQQFMHVHHERLCSLQEEIPESSAVLPEKEWLDEKEVGRIAELLTESAAKVREAIKQRIFDGRDLDLNFGHPALMLQFLLWHEGYHHGQIKLALKISGVPIPNDIAGAQTWDVWRRRWKKA